MTTWIINWLISTVSLLLAAKIIPGITVTGLAPALIAAILIGFLNATLGFVLKIITFPISIITLGLFLLVINALMFWLAAALVPGFRVRGFWPAFLGALLMAIVGMILRNIVF